MTDMFLILDGHLKNFLDKGIDKFLLMPVLIIINIQISLYYDNIKF